MLFVCYKFNSTGSMNDCMSVSSHCVTWSFFAV
uniref:Uncharacterized protein n=1 Tax=Anguilla anguilla TaxID=7936 RepID=A0A0E9QVX2_ANGAN